MEGDERTKPAMNGADALLALHPEIDTLLVRVRRWEIDRASSLLVPHDRDFRFGRNGTEGS